MVYAEKQETAVLLPSNKNTTRLYKPELKKVKNSLLFRFPVLSRLRSFQICNALAFVIPSLRSRTGLKGLKHLGSRP
jgi:hypothetical protein